MNKERLLLLADHLKTVRLETFSLNNWSCGATACAIGHAASIPAFQKLGFVLQRGVGEDRAYPVFKDHVVWGAVQLFFDLEPSEAKELFADVSYPKDAGPSLVEKRIRDFVEGEV